MPNFQRPLYPEGFLGDYGEQRALDLLEGLYREQKRGRARRKAFATDCEEFGRVRYLVANPGHPERSRTILGRGDINSNVWVQFEDDGPYRYARLFDAGTGQPFLGEASVFETGVEEYITGVKGDLAFRLHIKRTRHRLLSHIVPYTERLQTFGITPRQLDLLSNFGSASRAGDLGLDAQEVEQLILRGYLIRDPQRGVTERIRLEEALAKTLKNAAGFDAAGKADDSARCRAKARRLQNRRLC